MWSGGVLGALAIPRQLISVLAPGRSLPSGSTYPIRNRYTDFERIRSTRAIVKRDSRFGDCRAQPGIRDGRHGT